MTDKAEKEALDQSAKSEGDLQTAKTEDHDASPTKNGEKAAEKPAEKTSDEKKPSKFKQLLQKAGLDFPTVAMMFKGSLPPTIAIAMYQSDAVSSQYGTLGYLIAISSFLGFAIMPQGKFIQTMTLNVLSICFSAAINLLSLYCVVKARQHTTPPDAPPGVPTYNASASAVAAVWLCFQVYVVNVLKTARPQLQFPSIVYSIFVLVSLTYGVLFLTMSEAIGFMENLLEAFLTGFALATGVHFLVFPVTSRKVVFKEMAGYLQFLNACIKAQHAYMRSLEDVDPAKLKAENEKQDETDAKSKHKKNKTPRTILETPALGKLRETHAKYLELHAKLNGDITPAKREIAYGKLESHDITQLWKHMRVIFLPVSGLIAVINILERQTELRGWAREDGTPEEIAERRRQVANLHFLLKELHEPFAKMSETLDGAFQHLLLTLEFVKPPKKKQPDEESNGDDRAKPGSPGFAEAFKKKVEGYFEQKKHTLRDWALSHGVDLPPDFFEPTFVWPENMSIKDENLRETNQRQLFFILYLEYLLYRVSNSVLELVLYVEKRKQEGVFEKSKLIFPGSKTLYKWVTSAVGQEDVGEEDPFTSEISSGGLQTLYLGQEFKRRDPEHLAPRNTTEMVGDAIRRIPRFFRSEESVFGLRVVAATMSIGIVCFLRSSQDFFLRNRFSWAMIMIAISMTRTSGQSVFNYTLRILGTVVAMIGSYVIYYIVDGIPAGVIVFLWLWIFCAFYVVLKFPKFLIAGILSLITAVIIIGYELQVKKIGVALSTANGQPAYPTYELAPYRLAVVAGGLVIAFIWTVFPFPVSESSELRKDISAALHLLSYYYGAVHETVKMRVRSDGGDETIKGTHAYNLGKARQDAFTKLLVLANRLKQNAGFSKFQIRIGGQFPRQDYEQLIQCINRLILWVSLASYSSMTFEKSSSADATTWANDFRQMLSEVSVTTNKITSLLSLLGSSLGNGQPLPPYLEMPHPFSFVKKMEAINEDILSIRHLAEPEYSAFAVMQVVSQNINMDVVLLVEVVKKLVGEADFSFKSIKSGSTSSYLTTIDSDEEKGKVE